ncbi:hypothetical protein SISNIDRAFT_491713 [Sistotremastrum niveocremeum HHB9708]|uniref:Zn(2)-C6 fungal-type domain-containing protein n=1 Tax=Sistotremastrum niveocremeum HHB9708 TaxID=1314777 RepID=A0A164MHG6_9AGAM|nr:hypothetical protein SISNIDRAFT_491713 [Sistotremastrum niveocremeum HHB9708]
MASPISDSAETFYLRVLRNYIPLSQSLPRSTASTSQQLSAHSHPPVPNHPVADSTTASPSRKRKASFGEEEASDEDDTPLSRLAKTEPTSKSKWKPIPPAESSSQSSLKPSSKPSPEDEPKKLKLVPCNGCIKRNLKCEYIYGIQNRCAECRDHHRKCVREIPLAKKPPQFVKASLVEDYRSVSPVESLVPKLDDVDSMSEGSSVTAAARDDEDDPGHRTAHSPEAERHHESSSKARVVERVEQDAATHRDHVSKVRRMSPPGEDKKPSIQDRTQDYRREARDVISHQKSVNHVMRYIEELDYKIFLQELDLKKLHLKKELANHELARLNFIGEHPQETCSAKV